MADAVHRGCDPEFRVLFAHRADDLPMRFGERADADLLRNRLRERL
jgi:hypothetical protein